MRPQDAARAQQALDRMAARGPDLQPLSLAQALAHPTWWLVLYRLLSTTKP
ncbi:MAG: hypothetical protein RL758_1803 [Pseudomonadota bacterium]|jgi:hypothetical protein